MPDAIFADPRLAAVYDVFNPPGSDTAFYLDLAGSTSRRILDMGCGTGHLACDLALRGHQVTGADPAGAMLAVARQRRGSDKVRWVETDAAGLMLDDSFDFAVMTGHVFQVFLTDEDVQAALRILFAHLAPGGQLTFETRHPSTREWLEWTPEKTRERCHVDGVGTVQVEYDFQSASDALVTFKTHYGFPDGDTISVPSTLRFMRQDEVEAHLRDAGFTNLTWFGDWDRSPVSPDSPEIIVIAAQNR
jgi:SAM-dependent methyltransferase